MTKNQSKGNNLKVKVGGDVSRQVAVDKNISQVSTKTAVTVIQAELQGLRDALKELRAKVENESQPDKK